LKALFVALTLGLAAIAPATAADLPTTKGPPPAPTVAPYNWTGFYAGVDAGYGWEGSTGSTYCAFGGVINGTGCSTPESGLLDPSGGLFGGLAGYNFQSGMFVFGAETDLQWSNIADSTTASIPCCGGAPTSSGPDYIKANLDWFGTARARIGVTPVDRLLIYATGGLIYGEEKTSSNLRFSATDFYPTNGDSTRTGWTLGGGAEYAFTGNITARIEGLYYDLGSQKFTFNCTTQPTCVSGYSQTTKYDYTGGILRAALIYKF